MEDSISLYNKSGVFKDFEDTFAAYHGMEYALLSNSGTSALFSIMEGMKLSPEDEVICPAYTFFATVSPIGYTGAKLVFCDCLPDGNIDPEQIRLKITPKTKAVFITHMWGIPCKMDEISALCKEHNLYLVEDCSHAHGATFKGKPVGSFGDASAWSLQGQKIISGGEGGIMLTNNREIFNRALLQGHYNKRCKQEIPKGDPLYVFAQTGFGLKLRAHPLAIALAYEQFSQIDQFLAQKREFAQKITHALEKVPFLKMPVSEFGDPSWYAFVMQFNPQKSNGVTIDQFESALLAEGLSEVDRPGSTGLIASLPLFTQPYLAMPRLYRDEKPQTQLSNFPNAQIFYENAIKLPVWAFSDEQFWVDSYIKGILKVADAVLTQPNQF